MDAGEFWGYSDDEEPGSPFGAFFTSHHLVRRLLWMLQGKG